MTTKLNKDTYEKLIEADLKFMEAAPKTLEREHIMKVLRASIDLLYPILDVGDLDVDAATLVNPKLINVSNLLAQKYVVVDKNLYDMTAEQPEYPDKIALRLRGFRTIVHMEVGKILNILNETT